jgi:16S rRNA pseudouridine516 synthase
MYNQIKRMFHAHGCCVTYLKRLSIGGLALDHGLPEGAARRLTAGELAIIMLNMNKAAN